MPAPELRCRLSAPIMGKLRELQQHLGYRHGAGAVEYLVVDAHQRLLGGTRWEQQQAQGLRVLKRLKPEVLLSLDDVTDVDFKDDGERVLIHVRLNPQPYQVSRREWEK
jgi:hypothetical protein